MQKNIRIVSLHFQIKLEYELNYNMAQLTKIISKRW